MKKTMEEPAPSTPGTKHAQATIETPEPASVSKYLAKFEKPENVALMPDKTLMNKTPTKNSNSKNQQQQQQQTQESGTVPISSAEAAPEAVSDFSQCALLAKSHVPFLALAKERAPKSLRICCFGSSSSKTPESYLRPAAEVGYLLAVRGHICVNGAGSFGCMAAINDGAAAGNGHIVGVIHKMWLVDSHDDSGGGGGIAGNAPKEWGVFQELRDGGAHPVFESKPNDGGGSAAGIPQSHGGPHSVLTSATQTSKRGTLRQMLVAGGKDLQERKRLLVEGANALIVLPGGPGTWDELWEMACARNIGLSKLPIVCVNIDGYYDPFRQMLHRAWKDQLTKLEPDEIVHFANTAEEAVQWAEEAQSKTAPAVVLKKRQELLRGQSVLGTPIVEQGNVLLRSLSSVMDWSTTGEGRDSATKPWIGLILSMSTGILLGFLLSENRKRYQ